MSDIKFETQLEWKGELTVEAKARDFTLFIDEPPNLGGQDKGPNPVEYECYKGGRFNKKIIYRNREG